MLTWRLYLAQRITALLLAPLVIGHLVMMIYAIQGGLTGAEILARTRGSGFWMWFYEAFVICVAIHGAIGVRVIAHEWFGLRKAWLEQVTFAVGATLFALGSTAVVAVTLP